MKSLSFWRRVKFPPSFWAWFLSIPGIFPTCFVYRQLVFSMGEVVYLLCVFAPILCFHVFVRCFWLDYRVDSRKNRLLEITISTKINYTTWKVCVSRYPNCPWSPPNSKIHSRSDTWKFGIFLQGTRTHNSPLERMESGFSDRFDSISGCTVVWRDC